MAFSRIIGSGALEALVAHVDLWRKGNMEKTRQGLNACAYREHQLGGSREVAIPGTALIEAFDSRPFTARDALYSGFVFTAFFHARVEAGGSVFAVLKDDLGTIVHTFANVTAVSASWSEERFTFTPTVGRSYTLYVQKNNDAALGWGYGYVVQLAQAL